MNEMRKDRRAPASLKVKYKSATVDEFIAQFGVDISRGGIFIKTKKPLDLGMLLKLEFQLSDGSSVIQGTGRVAWCRSEQNARPDLPAGMGLQFISLDDESLGVIELIVSSHGPGSRFEQTSGAEIAPPLSSLFPAARNSVLPPPGESALVRASMTPAGPRASVAPAGPRASVAPAGPRASVAPAASPPFSGPPPARSSIPLSSPAPAIEEDAASASVSARPPPLRSSLAAPKLPEGMAGSFFPEESAKPSTMRVASHSPASAFGVDGDGAGGSVSDEARAKGEQPRDSVAELADSLFADVAPAATAASGLFPLGDPEELAGVARASELKIPSLDEVVLTEQIPSLEELENEEAAAAAAQDGEQASSAAPPKEPRAPAPRLEPPQTAVPSTLPPSAKGSRLGLLVTVFVLLIAAGGAYFVVTQDEDELVISATPVPVELEATGEPSAASGDTRATAPAREPDIDSPSAAFAAPSQPAAADEPQQPGPPVPVNVTSLPRDAELRVDGKPAGKTPITLSLPSARPIELSVHSAGYASEARSVVPRSGMEPVRFKLAPLPYVLVLQTDPPGATLRVRDRSAVSPSPIELGQLEGFVVVSIEKAGYQRTSRTVRLDEFKDRGDAMRAEISLGLTPLPVDKQAPGARKPVPAPAPAPRVTTDPPPTPEPDILKVKQQESSQEAKPEPASTPKPEAKPESTSTPKPEAKPEPTSTPKPEAKPEPTSMPSQPSGEAPPQNP